MKNIMIVLIAASVGYIHQDSVLRSNAREMRSDERTIRISASTFEFTPNEITVKKGTPVTLELISQDRHHGFNLSKFHLHADLKPGVVEKSGDSGRQNSFSPDRRWKGHSASPRG